MRMEARLQRFKGKEGCSVIDVWRLPMGLWVVQSFSNIKHLFLKHEVEISLTDAYDDA